MKSLKNVLIVCGFLIAGSALLGGCSLFGKKDEPSEPTYNINYFSYTDSNENLPYGSVIINENSSYYKSSEGLTLVAPTCTGYAFDGWYEGVYWSTPQTLCWDDAEKIEKIEIGSTGDYILYGKWHKGEFEITFDAGDGEFENGVKTKSLFSEFEEEIDLTGFEIPTKEGFEFDAWIDLPEKMPAENLTVYASWCELYNVTYVLNTDESLQANEIAWTWENDEKNPEKYSKASNFSLKSPTTTRPGYGFSGWYLEYDPTKTGIDSFKNQVVKLGDVSALEGKTDITLYAFWYKLFTIDLDNSTIYSTTSIGLVKETLTIPHKIVDDNGLVRTITKIGGGGQSVLAMSSNVRSSVKNLIIEEGVKSIASYAFKEASSLEMVVLPSTLTYVGKDAFNNTSLSQLNTRNGNNIEENKLPLGLTSIGDSAFYGAGCNFGVFSFPESLTEIGSFAFFSCEVREITIYSNTSVGGSAFMWTGVEKITIQQATTQGFPNCHDNVIDSSFNATISETLEIVMNSVYAYVGSEQTIVNGGNFFGFIEGANTVRVRKDFVDNTIKAYENRDNKNAYLNNENNFTKNLDGDYYVYTRK